MKTRPLVMLLAGLGLSSLLACAGPGREETAGAPAGGAFRDCADCPEMVAVPAGSFTMGSPGDEPGRSADEGPQHRVNIARPFAVGRYHVTHGQFAAFVRETSYDTGDKCNAGNGVTNEEKSGNWRNPVFEQADNEPVVCVNWNDAKAYAAWLARKTGKNYRLLTEAEWEYAARAGTGGRRYWGDNDNDICRSANVADAATKDTFKFTNTFACNDGHGATSPVGRFPPNGFGLYDMLGNAWQWTEDCYGANYASAPTDGSAAMNGDCGQHVLRGGSWSSNPMRLRAAARLRNLAAQRGNGSGFRIARSD